MQAIKKLVNRCTRWCILACFCYGFTITSFSAYAFETLNEAQTHIYDSNHLSTTSEGQVLTYRYLSQDSLSDTTEDEAKLSIVATHDDGRRDVEVDFLSDERHLPLPPFEAFKGNPVIIAMLEHIAQSMSSQSGGGALYFRNRIRDALASQDVQLEDGISRYQDSDYKSTTITFYPFVEDQYLAKDDVIRQSRFSILLSDDIPGAVLQVQVSAEDDSQVFERTLSLL